MFTPIVTLLATTAPSFIRSMRHAQDEICACIALEKDIVLNEKEISSFPKIPSFCKGEILRENYDPTSWDLYGDYPESVCYAIETIRANILLHAEYARVRKALADKCEDHQLAMIE
jgi:hypothetical protein